MVSDTTDESPNSDAEVIQEPVNTAIAAGPSTDSYSFYKSLSNIPTADAPADMTDMSAINRSDTEIALHTIGEDNPSEPRIMDCTETITLRYTDKKLVGAIQSPVQGLWIDRSEVKGKLHWMKAANIGEQTNVCLVWEGVNEVEGEKSFC